MSNKHYRKLTLFYIYEITNNINGKNYIGKHACPSNRTPETDRYMGSGVLITKAIKKHGKENFSKRVLATCYLEEIENILETEYIAIYKSIGKAEYNIAKGGEGVLGLVHSEETKQKIREKRKLQIITEEAKRKMSENNKGKHFHDDEWKQNMSEKFTGREVSDKQRQQISNTLKQYFQTEEGKQKIKETAIKNSNNLELRKKLSESLKKFYQTEEGKKLADSKRKPRTEETKRKISEKLKGRDVWNKGLKLSEEYCRKLSEAHKGKESPMKGKTYSQEARNRMSEAHKGNKQSEETKKKISEFNKGKIISEKQRKQISQALKGTHYYNNGEIEVRCREQPQGFVPGRLPTIKQKISKK